MIIPPFLKPGDKFAIISPSGTVLNERIDGAANAIRQWGFTPVLGEHCRGEYHAYDVITHSASPEHRLADLQWALSDPEVKAILCSRGGYGAVHLLDYLDLEALAKNPKWIIGYSDVTALHIALNNMGFETILGPMMRGFNNDKESNSALQTALFSQSEPVTLNTNENCVKGNATGRLVGGNLSIIYSLSGTAFDLNTKDAILFIEDTGEANYSVDRMLLNLQQSGKLTDIKGLIVGEFINNNQGNDLPLPAIIKKYFEPLNIPIIYGYPNGHDIKNMPLPLGSRCTIDINETEATVTFNKPEA